MSGGGIDILGSIEDLTAVSQQGWAISISTSTGQERLELVGITARRDVPGGTIEVSVRKVRDSETVESLAKDLRDLLDGIKVKRVGWIG